MNKSLFAAAVLFLALSSNTSIFSMISATQWHPDISQHICSRLSKEDNKDFRLVCRDWARKDLKLKLMPKCVEKEYDKIIKKKKELNAPDKQIILLVVAAKNDFDATEWIIKRTSSYGLHINSKYITDDNKIFPHMLAIHNNNREMARLLIESDKNNKNKDWKACYKEITIPKGLEQCLYPINKHDFSFLPYLIAVLSDNDHDLKKLYSQKKPTELGQQVIIDKCIKINSQKCFNLLLKKKTTKEIIIKDGAYFFLLSLATHTKKIPKKLIDNKLFNINSICTDTHRTVLDLYQQDEIFKNDKQVQDILIELGAKTSKQVQEIERLRRIKRQAEYARLMSS